MNIDFDYRLGGIPTGVVAVETRCVELSVPADPANLDSEAKVHGEVQVQTANTWQLDVNKHLATSTCSLLVPSPDRFLVPEWENRRC